MRSLWPTRGGVNGNTYGYGFESHPLDNESMFRIFFLFVRSEIIREKPTDKKSSMVSRKVCGSIPWWTTNY